VFATDHERADPREIALICEQLQVEHQLDVLFEGLRDASRLRHQRELATALLFRALDAPLDVANRVEILANLPAIAEAQLALQVGDRLGHRIQDAAVLLELLEAHGRIGRPAVAEQALEDLARVLDHRENLRGAAPRNRVRQRTAAAVAAARAIARVEA